MLKAVASTMVRSNKQHTSILTVGKADLHIVLATIARRDLNDFDKRGGFLGHTRRSFLGHKKCWFLGNVQQELQ